MMNHKNIRKGKITNFVTLLSKWSDKNGLRDYPWRKTAEPFKILISEILLRRTKSDKVAELYDEVFGIINNFDDIVENQDHLREVLYPLGFINHRMNTLLEIAINLKGREVPTDQVELMELYGVGRYISGMVGIMVNNEKKLVYDTNFRRIYSRFFGMTLLKDLKRDKNIESLSERIIPKEDPKQFVLTVLDFGALICRPLKPNCNGCPLNINCSYFKSL